MSVLAIVGELAARVRGRADPAPRREPATYDLTRADYAFRPKDGGQRGHIACWSGRKPFRGDYLVLRNGADSSRYRVTDVDLCLDVDPPTMWMAGLEFAPSPLASLEGGLHRDHAV